MGRYIIISKIFESNDQHDYAICYNSDKIDFWVRVIPSQKTIIFYKDKSFKDYFYIIDMNVPGYDEKPLDYDLDKNIIPREAFVLAAYRLKKAILEGVFPNNLSKYS